MKNKNIKKQFKFKWIYLLVLLVIIISFSIAKYQSDIQKPGTGIAANWSFKVLLNDREVKEDFQINLVDTLSNSSNKIDTGVIAPGSVGHFKISIDTRGTEVGVKYLMTLTDTNSNIPNNLKFYSDSNCTPESEMNFGTTINYIALSEISIIKEHNIYWKWNSTNEDISNADDVSKNSQDFKIGVKVEGSQYLKDISLEETDEMYFDVSSTGVLTIKPEKENDFISDIKDLVIPQAVNGTVVTSIGKMAFADMKNLKNLVIKSELVTSINNSAFKNCSNLEAVSISNSVANIDDFAFYGCTNLQTIILPKGVKNIGSWAFKDCAKLTSMSIPSTVESIGESAFSGCSNLEEINLPSEITTINKWTFLNCEKLLSIVIPSKVTNIQEGAFAKCTQLANVQIGEKVESIGDSAFFQCANLSTIVIPNSVTSIENLAFAQCIILKNVTIPTTTNVNSTAFEETIYGSQS